MILLAVWHSTARPTKNPWPSSLRSGEGGHIIAGGLQKSQAGIHVFAWEGGTGGSTVVVLDRQSMIEASSAQKTWQGLNGTSLGTGRSHDEGVRVLHRGSSLYWRVWTDARRDATRSTSQRRMSMAGLQHRWWDPRITMPGHHPVVLTPLQSDEECSGQCARPQVK